MQEGDIVCDFFQIIGDMGREEDAVLLVLNEFEQEVEDIIPYNRVQTTGSLVQD